MATSLLNRAQLSYTFNGSAGSAVSNQTNTTLLDQYTITVTKDTLTPEVKAGCNAAYVVRVENNGAGTINEVTVVDNLGGTGSGDAVLTYVDESAKFYLNGTPIEGNAETGDDGVTFTTATPLESGDNLLIFYVATLDSAQTEPVTNTASVTAATSSPTEPTVSGSDTATVTPTTYADVSMIKSADKDTVVSGDTLTYTFALINTGFEAAESITLTDEFPDEFTVTSVSYTANGVTTPVSSDDYTLEGETLTLPASSSSLVISVPAATSAGPGLTTITVTGTVA